MIWDWLEGVKNQHSKVGSLRIWNYPIGINIVRRARVQRSTSRIQEVLCKQKTEAKPGGALQAEGQS